MSQCRTIHWSPKCCMVCRCESSSQRRQCSLPRQRKCSWRRPSLDGKQVGAVPLVDVLNVERERCLSPDVLFLDLPLRESSGHDLGALVEGTASSRPSTPVSKSCSLQCSTWPSRWIFYLSLKVCLEMVLQWWHVLGSQETDKHKMPILCGSVLPFSCHTLGSSQKEIQSIFLLENYLKILYALKNVEWTSFKKALDTDCEENTLKQAELCSRILSAGARKENWVNCHLHGMMGHWRSKGLKGTVSNLHGFSAVAYTGYIAMYYFLSYFKKK